MTKNAIAAIACIAFGAGIADHVILHRKVTELQKGQDFVMTYIKKVEETKNCNSEN